MLEKTLLMFLRKGDIPIHEEQHAYKEGRNCATALLGLDKMIGELKRKISDQKLMKLYG